MYRSCYVVYGTVGGSQWGEIIGWGVGEWGVKGYWGTGGEVTGYWRKLHKEELRDWYFSPRIIQAIKKKDDMMGEACNT